MGAIFVIAGVGRTIGSLGPDGRMESAVRTALFAATGLFLMLAGVSGVRRRGSLDHRFMGGAVAMIAAGLAYNYFIVG